MADIIELVMADQQRIGHLPDVLRQAGRADSATESGQVTAGVWERLAALIEAYADAEEEICHLPIEWVPGCGWRSHRAATPARAAWTRQPRAEDVTFPREYQIWGAALCGEVRAPSQQLSLLRRPTQSRSPRSAAW